MCRSLLKNTNWAIGQTFKTIISTIIKFCIQIWQRLKYGANFLPRLPCSGMLCYAPLDPVKPKSRFIHPANAHLIHTTPTPLLLPPHRWIWRLNVELWAVYRKWCCICVKANWFICRRRQLIDKGQSGHCDWRLDCRFVVLAENSWRKGDLLTYQ